MNNDERFDRIDAQLEAIAVRFEKVDSRFEKMDARFEVMDARFEAITKRMDARFEAITKRMDARFEAVDKQLDTIAIATVRGFNRIDAILETKANAVDLDRTIGLLDAITKRQEVADDERQVISHQLTRLEKWVERAAERIDVKFAH